jgi:hypothetical protein
MHNAIQSKLAIRSFALLMARVENKYTPGGTLNSRGANDDTTWILQERKEPAASVLVAHFLPTK